MSTFYRSSAAALVLSGVAAFAAGAAAADESTCTLPGVTVLQDGGGDVAPGVITDTSGPLPVGLPLDYDDLLSLQVGQAAAADGSPRLVFTLGVASLTTLPSLPPNATWFVSFKAPDKKLHGVRMVTDQTGAETYQSYLVDPGGLQGDGPSDGRFSASEKPLEADSNFTDTAITFVVKPEDVGVKDVDAVLSSFNAAALQSADLVAVGFADTFDTMPEALAREGKVELSKCAGGGKSLMQKFGGALGFGLLLPLLGLAGLRRRGS